MRRDQRVVERESQAAQEGAGSTFIIIHFAWSNASQKDTLHFIKNANCFMNFANQEAHFAHIVKSARKKQTPQYDP